MGDISALVASDAAVRSESVFDVEQVLKELTTLEKIDLLAGKTNLYLLPTFSYLQDFNDTRRRFLAHKGHSST